ncbi:MAG: hypothetical protein R2715_11095 [Ilumatobacteraceae bacterium]
MASFRDRFFTPKVARAMLSPSGMLVAGGSAAVVILAGGGLLALPAAALAWGARVLVAVPRNQRHAAIDAYALSEPWKQYMLGAEKTKRRFDEIVKTTKNGPIKDRLLTMAERLDAGLLDCWRIASRGDEIDEALQRLDTEQAMVERATLRQSIGGRAPTEAEASTLRSLDSQLATADRMQGISADAQARLRLLDARLDELVAKAVEVSVGAGDSSWLSQEVDGVVEELEALRLALEDTNAAARRGAGTDLPPELGSSTTDSAPPRPGTLPPPPPGQTFPPQP